MLVETNRVIYESVTDNLAIKCENLWKIFGARAQEALVAAKAGEVDKDEAFKRFGCVIGVADARFSVKTGEIFCIMGLSGSGKSTLIRHVNRLMEPTEGKIYVGGKDVMGLNDKDLRDMRARKIGMVFQHMALWPHKTIAENVAFGLEVQNTPKDTRRAAAEDALAKVGLKGWGDRYPDQLSGGMQQRVGLARAFAADPDILLMDEPFSALDPLIRNELQDEFLKLSHEMKKTTLFITHDLDEAMKIGNRIAIMKDGRIQQTDTPENIVLRPANDYVTRFVGSISTLKYISAVEMMKPGPASEGAREFGPSASLPVLLQAFAEGATAISIVEGSNSIGVITPADIFDTVKTDLARA